MMSRKSKIDDFEKEDWSCVKLWSLNLGYAPFKPDKSGRIKNALVILHYDARSNHVMIDWAKIFQQIFTDSDNCIRTVIVMDIAGLLTDVESCELLFDEEGKTSKLDKRFSKPLSRILKKMLLSKATLFVSGSLSQIALKLLALNDNCLSHQLTHENIARLVLVHPILPVSCVNAFLREPLSEFGRNTCVDIAFTSEKEYERRMPMLRAVFPRGETRVCLQSTQDAFFSMLGDKCSDRIQAANLGYRKEWATECGETMWYSKLAIEMNKVTKQYELYVNDITPEINELLDSEEEGELEDVHEDVDEHEEMEGGCKGQAGPPECGALVLRGNRCVLVRSLTGLWSGMRLPAAPVIEGESPQQAAVRSMAVLCDIEPEEMTVMDIPPVLIYPNVSPAHPNTAAAANKGGGRSAKAGGAVHRTPHTRGIIALYAMYAVQPPPDGPLEDADIEDEDDCYDWYTWPRAIHALTQANDYGAILALRTMACSLHAAAAANVIPIKWGGVFGQEWEVLAPLRSPLLINSDATSHIDFNTPTANFASNTGSTSRAVSAAEALGYTVRATTEASAHREESKAVNQERTEAIVVGGNVSKVIGGATDEADGKAKGVETTEATLLPVTVLSGFLGSGKTTLLQHILTNQVGLRVAVIVNDMADVNIDAALVQQGALAVSQREEKMVELKNGCICCTLREDLLQEIGKLAAEKKYDYLVIESSGISEPLPVAETFTFEDDAGRSLSSLARLDTLVTVVDAHSFMAELSSVELLKERKWQATADDERSVAQLLCDQIEFSNVIIINKADLVVPADMTRLQHFLRKLNPEADLVMSSYGVVDVARVLNTRRFSLQEAEKSSEWLQQARLLEHKPETEEYGISSFTFRAVKPLHPQRFWDLLQRISSCRSETSSRSEEISQPLKSILRAKGFAWLCTRGGQQAVFSFAGRTCTLTPGSPWWAVLDRAEWPAGLVEAIAPLWHDPYGDRQNEIVVIGQEMEHESVKVLFTACLLTEDELAAGPEAWATYSDPFAEDWDAHEMTLLDNIQNEHSHDHDHAHQHHDHHN